MLQQGTVSFQVHAGTQCTPATLTLPLGAQGHQ